ncbi:hypothetical protein ABLG96_09945 [Nakamurella sp. A5-74]|uniref:Uncharacterized protein n=1 Tax=Nakamurella sp. A5-74 TaxID=3158264 RepID=A0AAU8DXI4_9ACTN
MPSGLTLTTGAAPVLDGPLVVEGVSEDDEVGEDEVGEDDLEEDDALDDDGLDDGPEEPDVVDGAGALLDDPDVRLPPPPGTVTAVPGALLDPVLAGGELAVTVSSTVLRASLPELQPVANSAAAAVSATGARKRRTAGPGAM